MVVWMNCCLGRIPYPITAGSRNKLTPVPTLVTRWALLYAYIRSRNI
jgi:hypothetical protein